MFGLYVHIPFCVHRCSYCDFYSSTKFDAVAFDQLTDRLCWEAGAAAKWLEHRGKRTPVTSIFFGGGTPSLLPVSHLSRIFQRLLEDFQVEPSAEITLEANPETVNEEFAASLFSSTPVNRVSLGAQSFKAEHLSKLERLGSSASIRNAVRVLRGAGLRNYSLDLIFGIPGQSAQDLLQDIDEAVALEPMHLSFYSLTLKPGHRLYCGLPDDDQAADLYEQGRARLSEHGYDAYEISNFSRAGFESRHNLLYWSGGDFLGLGPSASTRFFWDGSFHHRKQVANWEQYLKVDRFPNPAFESTTAFQTVLEASFLELRKREGIALEAFSRRYRYDLTRAKQFSFLSAQGLVEKQDGSLRLTSKGWLLAEGIAERLVDQA